MTKESIEWLGTGQGSRSALQQASKDGSKQASLSVGACEVERGQ